MLTYDQIRTVVDHHEQKRSTSCVQSAVEMVLKLNGIIGINEYPEQAHEHLDEKGFAAYNAIGNRRYGGFLLTFREKKYDSDLCGDWRREAWMGGIDRLRGEIFPIFSFALGSDFHCYLGIPCSEDKMQFITKPKVGPCEAEIQSRLGIWKHQLKTEILTIRCLLLH